MRTKYAGQAIVREKQNKVEDYLTLLVLFAVFALIFFHGRKITAPHNRPPSRPNHFSIGKSSHLQNQRLDYLDFVVFDTETTGLNPAQGDEIVQLGGIKIEQGHIDYDNTFELLVNPGFEIPPRSTLIHGITDEMVKSACTPEEALIKFRSFVSGSVLIAHCANFDMELLNGPRREVENWFHNPVLDTMLLSFATEPSHFDLSLETLAEKFELEIWGRHTAIGDAAITAEIFLKLLPLLSDMGITTLENALDTCNRLSQRPEFS